VVSAFKSKRDEESLMPAQIISLAKARADRARRQNPMAVWMAACTELFLMWWRI
jgi:hypothetical protein